MEPETGPEQRASPLPAQKRLRCDNESVLALPGENASERGEHARSAQSERRALDLAAETLS